MKKYSKNRRITSVIALILTCVLSISLFSCNSDKDSDRKEKDKDTDTKIDSSITQIMSGSYKEVDIPNYAPSTVKNIYEVTKKGESQGNVVIVEVDGYAGKIRVGVGIDTAGNTTKVVILKDGETHGQNMDSMLEALSSGKNLIEIADVDVVSGATISSNAIKTAVSDAFAALGQFVVTIPDDDLPTSETILLSYAREMVGMVDFFVNVTPGGGEYVKRVFQDSDGRGYIVYLVVMSQYGTVETETLVYVGNNGRINDIMKLTWKTSDAMYGYQPPEVEVVDAFYESLKGMNISDLRELEALESNHDGLLVTNATSTSRGLVQSLIEGLEAVNTLRGN